MPTTCTNNSICPGNERINKRYNMECAIKQNTRQ